MAVKAAIDGKPLGNVSGYSIDEDSTPINPADETGGASQINVTVPKFAGWRTVEDKSLRFSDSTQGKTSGVATAASEQNGLVQVTANSRILSLSVLRTAKPFRGSLGDALRYYFGLVGITDGILIEDEIATIPVVFPGWREDVYQQVARKICPAFGIEMSLVSDNITIRQPRQTRAVLQRIISISETLDSGDRAQRSKLNWYGTRWVEGEMVYPTGGWNQDVEVFDVNAGQVKVYENVEISASLSSVIQPTCVANVGPDFNSASVYTVVGTDGFPVPPAMWKAYGGELRVEINEDTRSLKVTIRGMDLSQYSPYQIAVSSGDGNNYSTLRILGTGVVLDPKVADLSTGLGEDEAPNEYSDEVDNVFINDATRAYTAAAWQVGDATGPRHGLSFTAAGINRKGNSGSTEYATFQDFDDEYVGQNTDAFDAIWAGKPEAEWNKFWLDKVASEFKNQAFGNVAGARIIRDGCFYRIRSSNNTSGLIQGNAEADNTVGDFDAYYAGMTDDDWDAMWSGKKLQDFDVRPFPDVKIDGTRPAKVKA